MRSRHILAVLIVTAYQGVAAQKSPLLPSMVYGSVVDIAIHRDTSQAVRLFITGHGELVTNPEFQRPISLNLSADSLGAWMAMLRPMLISGRATDIPREGVFVKSRSGAAGLGLTGNPEDPAEFLLLIQTRDPATKGFSARATRAELLVLFDSLSAVASRPGRRTQSAPAVACARRVGAKPKDEVEMPELHDKGQTTVEFVIDRKGRIVDSTIVFLSTSGPRFTEATIKVLNKLRFIPATCPTGPVDSPASRTFHWTK